MATKTIFVAATNQHVGKTTCTLGLVANFQNKGYKVGYCKPVGQQFINVKGTVADKDAVLFSKSIGFEINPQWHSPVVLARGATKEFIKDSSQYHFEEQIINAANYLENNNDIVVYEGTGHPGVGTVVDLSNAQVAKLLGAGLIMVVEGGIGRTIDRLSMSLALFREQSVPILGVIINKVRAEKIEEIGFYLRKKLGDMEIPVLGLLPYDQTLSLPIMATIKQAVNGKVMFNGHKVINRVEDIIAGSLLDSNEFNKTRNLLLVVSYKRMGEAIDKVKSISKIKNLKKPPLSGVLVTGDGRDAHFYNAEELRHPYFSEHEIPVITTILDTYGSVVKISGVEVKINTRTPWKVRRAIKLINQHMDFDLLMDRLDKN